MKSKQSTGIESPPIFGHWFPLLPTSDISTYGRRQIVFIPWRPPERRSVLCKMNKNAIEKIKGDIEIFFPLRQFLDLRSQLYWYSVIPVDTEKLRMKTPSRLNYELYRQCLFQRQTQIESMNLLQHRCELILTCNNAILNNFTEMKIFRRFEIDFGHCWDQCKSVEKKRGGGG